MSVDKWNRTHNLSKHSGKMLKADADPSPQGIAEADQLMQALHWSAVASMALIPLLSQIEMRIALGDATEGRPPVPEDRPLCLRRVAVSPIGGYILLTMLDGMMIV